MKQNTYTPPKHAVNQKRVPRIIQRMRSPFNRFDRLFFNKRNSFMDFLVEWPDGKREFMSENKLKKLGVL